jgi:hypothetical protein
MVKRRLATDELISEERWEDWPGGFKVSTCPIYTLDGHKLTGWEGAAYLGGVRVYVTGVRALQSEVIGEIHEALVRRAEYMETELVRFSARVESYRKMRQWVR